MENLIETLTNYKAFLQDGLLDDTNVDVEKEVDNIHRILLRILPKEMKFARQCCNCKDGMNAGFVIYGGDEYFCTDNCLRQEYNLSEIIEMELGEEHSDSYYTEWDDQDAEYILIDNQLILVEV